jgi:T5SS/PEP-CTERM-associated repeat protein
MNVALVTGPGSLWNSGTLYVGWNGSGNQLFIGGGGAVVSSVGYVGYSDLNVCSNNVAIVSDPGSVWSNSSLYVGYSYIMCPGNQLVLTNGGTVFASNMVVGAGRTANNLVRIESGTLRVAGGTGTGGLILGQNGQGRLLLDAGTVTVNRLVLTNGVNSVFTFNAGTLTSGGTFVTNNQLFVVGDGTNAATFQLSGGVHSFANDLEIRNNATLTGCGTVTGNVTVDPGGNVTVDCGGTLTFTGIVTNNGAMHPINGSVLEFYGTMVNNGTIDITTGTTNFHGIFINNGTIVTPPAPVVSFTASPTNGLAPLNVNFTEASTGSIWGWHWDFGDGNASTAQNPAHSYAAGTYTVRLIVNGPGGVTTNTKPDYIRVVPPPSTLFVDAANLFDRFGTLMPVNSVAVLVVDTGNSGFVDPQPDSPLSLGATWGTDNRIVGLWDLNNCGCGDGELWDQTVVGYTNGIAPGQKLQLYWFPSLTLASNTVGVTYYGKYSDTNSPPLNGGDAWQMPAGNSTVYLTFWTTSYIEGSLPDTAGQATNLTGETLAASFTGSPTNGTEPLSVTFTDTSTGTISNRFWNFGDGNTSNTTATNLSHTYNAGVHTVTLVVSGLAGVSTNTQPGYIRVLTPFAAWQMQYFGCTNCPQAVPGADPLGKGMSNTNQFLAGLNPTNSASVLRIISVVPQGDDIVITWTTAGGRTNVVQAAPNLGAGYSNISSNVLITGSGDTTTNYLHLGATTNFPSRFYRVRLVQ